ncbi:ThiF family adenylyltransferase [Rhizobium laguerreae]|uniref:ThiF family adenylyltransferase n=1 Tax=Rhizobium laguerreae TaxID=1076926 RepID=UPI001C9010FF|nr:ThiF family adenylyltransferase [Rhizobium laguerreae]MBY3201335.1 ThiF family adenylyltransferase [Rhizobium laguerreae]
MSQQPIARSPDLQRLRNEGYDISIVGAYLVMRGIPYLNERREVSRGVLISALELVNDIAVQPTDHTTYFDGAKPYHDDGRAIDEIIHSASGVAIGKGITGRFYLSAKPQPKLRYDNYYHKMATYAEIIGRPTRAADPEATAQTFALVAEEDEESVFNYMETASARADITEVADKLRGQRIAIVGLGGTGSYVLDYVVKTHAGEVHAIDGDKFLQHNAFRSPGAASGEELEEQMYKVDYLHRKYKAMRKGIIPHPVYLSRENLHLLKGMDFVFLTMEGGSKRPVIEFLEQESIPFIDVGMGLYLANGMLGGLLRTTFSTASMRRHVHERGRIPFGDADGRNEYDKNIQIVELNALNAALAVIRWKKHFGYYLDQEHEHHSVYSIGGNELTNDDGDDD